MPGTNKCREPGHLADQHTFDYDPNGNEKLGTAVTIAVASVTDSPIETVSDSLTESVNPDGINRLFQSNGNQPTGVPRVVLTVDGCFVTITGDGCITVEP